MSYMSYMVTTRRDVLVHRALTFDLKTACGVYLYKGQVRRGLVVTRLMCIGAR